MKEKHESFVPSDFSVRDISGYIITFAILAGLYVALDVALGVTDQWIPPWFGGKLAPYLYGMASGFCIALLLVIKLVRK